MVVPPRGVGWALGSLEDLPHHSGWCHTGSSPFLPLALVEPRGPALGGPSPTPPSSVSACLLQTHFLSCPLGEGGLGRTWSEDNVAQAGQVGFVVFREPQRAVLVLGQPRGLWIAMCRPLHRVTGARCQEEHTLCWQESFDQDTPQHCGIKLGLTARSPDSGKFSKASLG